MLKVGRFTLVAAMLALLGVGLAEAGAQARVRGIVVDSEGKPIPSAKVIVTSLDIDDYKKEISPKDDGTFSFVILDATRHYKFHVEADGYVPYEQEFKVPVGSTDNDFKFELKTRSEMVQAEQAEILEQPGYKQLGEANDLLKAGKKEEARAKFAEAAEAKPDLTQAWAALAQLDYEAGDCQKGLDAAKKCLDLDDESVQCLAVATNATKVLGLTDEHEKYLARYQEMNPEDPATLFNQAAGFLNKMDDEHARPLLEQCLQVDPDYGKCLFEYGMLLLRSGDMAGAKAQLEHYLEVAPQGPEAETARETLKYL